MIDGDCESVGAALGTEEGRILGVKDGRFDGLTLPVGNALG